MTGMSVGREDRPRTGPAQFLLRLLFPGARGHVELRVQRFGREDHEEVVGVGSQGGDQAAGAGDADVQERLVARGIRRHGSMPARMAASAFSGSLSTTTK